MKNSKIRMYWAFYKSTLMINLFFSFIISVFAGLIMFPVCFITGGPFMSFVYKEIARPNQYYFYNNRGISKFQLMIFTISVCILLGTPILILILYVASS